MFQPHPSSILTEHFRQKPHQGADLRSARFLFVGLDANYAADVEASPIFPRLLDYHEDGPEFWRSTGVHHPFLLPQYKGDGKRYHRTFSKIGFQPCHADQISFVELLDRPTVGRSSLVARDLDPQHLSKLHRAIFDGAAQFIFLSAGVQRLLVASGSFPRLSTVRRNQGVLRVLYEDHNRAIFLHLHFSNYGKFELQLQAEAKEIAALLADGTARSSLITGVVGESSAFGLPSQKPITD
jgi:hypothetical protein